MAEAILADDKTLLVAILEQRAIAKMEKEEEENRKIDQLNSDPYNAENQVIFARVPI
jgi:hypothetical protein